ncbi:site-specific integrase [Natroniella sulfidigena]|uniref:tyrosine-type recombinase/integrase n=1 Tax=Natroniella sulfidigena TaxID=723921 RepID=UPI00200A3432|nr:site-specific integrase [Natroniella sulfidigena]MCK8816601.1 site-specific integrase [Natroniella sulfidigena]
MLENMPKDDQWKIVDKDKNSPNYNKHFNFDFSFIASDEIKEVVKGYVWRNYREGNRALRGLYNQVSLLKKFNNFAISNDINSFKKLTNNDIENFISFLKTRISKRTKKSLSYRYQKGCLDALKSVIRWGQVYMPNKVPNNEIFTGNEFTGVNKKVKTEFIPNEVIKQINLALKDEENIYIKYGLVILQSTGMRVSDLLKLKVDCLQKHLISGWTLTYYDHKNRKQRSEIPIPNECAIAIQELIEETNEVREQADKEIKDNIFIHKVSHGRYYGEINIISQSSYKYWLDKFVENHNITGKDGKLYNLTVHQFRRTLATDMYSKGADLLVIRDMLGLSNAITASRHYADIKDKDRAKVFDKIGILGDIDNVDEEVISDKEKLEWFKENKNKGARMCDGYCSNPIENGEICDRLEKKKKCYTCKHYITTPEYLESHRKHLKELQEELDNNIYGQHYADHIIPTIEVLKEIIRRLEEL